MDEKPITAQLPQDAHTFDSLVPSLTKDGTTSNHHQTSWGCYQTPKRPGAE